MIRDRDKLHKLEWQNFSLHRLLQKWLLLLDFTSKVSQLSTVEDKKVGCVIFDPTATKVHAFSYNGPPIGMAHEPAPPATIPCPSCQAEYFRFVLKNLDSMITDPDEKDLVAWSRYINQCLAIDKAEINMVCPKCDGERVIPNPVSSGDMHAEVNSLLKLGYCKSLSAVMALTCSPCVKCCKSIIQSGRIGLVLYADTHAGYDPDILPAHGIATADWKEIVDAIDETTSNFTLRSIIDRLMERVKA